jgi:hypothetical protein
MHFDAASDGANESSSAVARDAARLADAILDRIDAGRPEQGASDDLVFDLADGGVDTTGETIDFDYGSLADLDPFLAAGSGPIAVATRPAWPEGSGGVLASGTQTMMVPQVDAESLSEAVGEPVADLAVLDGAQHDGAVIEPVE